VAAKLAAIDPAASIRSSTTNTGEEELLSVERDEWQELMKLQLGGPHHASELREIYAIMKTKYSFL
jgi:hypothetical protein